MLQLWDMLHKHRMFPQALQFVEYSDEDGDHCIGLITSKTMCSVLGALFEKGPKQTSICVEEDDQNGQGKRPGNDITHDQLAEGPILTWGEDLQGHNVVVSKYLKGSHVEPFHKVRLEYMNGRSKGQIAISYKL